MESPSVSKNLINAIRLFRDDVHLVWNNMIDRFVVIHVDKRTKHTRILLTVDDEMTGAYREPDMRILSELQKIDFDMLDAYPNPDDLVGRLIKDHDLRIEKKKAYQEDYRKWWNRDMRTFWKKAIENAKSGIFGKPEEAKRKIIIT